MSFECPPSVNYRASYQNNNLQIRSRRYARKVRGLLFSVAILTFILLSGASVAFAADQHPGDCFQQKLSLTQGIQDALSPKVAGMLSGVKTWLVPPLIVFAFVGWYVDFVAGTPDHKGLLTRLFLVGILLNCYGTGSGVPKKTTAIPGALELAAGTAPSDAGFRGTLIGASDALAKAINGGQDLDTVFPQLLNQTQDIIFYGDQAGSNDHWWQSIARSLGLLLSVAGWTKLLFIVAMLVICVACYALLVVASLYIGILDLFGPLCIALGIIAAGEKICWGWVSRYIEVLLYKPLFAGAVVVIFGMFTTVHTKMAELGTQWSNIQNPQDALVGFTCTTVGLLIAIVAAASALVIVISIPQIATSLVEGRSYGMGAAAAGLAALAAGMAASTMKLAAAPVAKGVGAAAGAGLKGGAQLAGKGLAAGGSAVYRGAKAAGGAVKGSLSKSSMPIIDGATGNVIGTSETRGAARHAMKQAMAGAQAKYQGSKLQSEIGRSQAVADVKAAASKVADGMQSAKAAIGGAASRAAETATSGYGKVAGGVSAVGSKIGSAAGKVKETLGSKTTDTYFNGGGGSGDDFRPGGGSGNGGGSDSGGGSDAGGGHGGSQGPSSPPGSPAGPGTGGSSGHAADGGGGSSSTEGANGGDSAYRQDSGSHDGSDFAPSGAGDVSGGTNDARPGDAPAQSSPGPEQSRPPIARPNAGSGHAPRNGSETASRTENDSVPGSPRNPDSPTSKHEARSSQGSSQSHTSAHATAQGSSQSSRQGNPSGNERSHAPAQRPNRSNGNSSEQSGLRKPPTLKPKN